MKQITITVPDNCELKQDGNTYTIVEKEKKLTYRDIIKELYPHANEKIMAGFFGSEKHLQKLIAINKLMNVAKYLNGDWQPNWEDEEEGKYFITFEHVAYELYIDCINRFQNGDVYFKSEELAQKAINILGEDTIKLALCTDY